MEELCRRFAGFGLERAVPEQVAGLEALAMIGGGVAARAVAGIIAKGAVQGPALTVAVAAAAHLRSELPAGVVLELLRHPDQAYVPMPVVASGVAAGGSGFSISRTIPRAW